MNLAVRAKFLAHQRNRLVAHLSLTDYRKCDFYSTKTTRSNKKMEDITHPGPEKPSSAASSTFHQRVMKQADELVWPKPREIPFQAKIANYVNLIGKVGIPVRFETSSEGKHFATTVISVFGETPQSPVSIPVVFEGDMAHVVACHVKKNDSVFVSGQLNVDSVGYVLSETFGKFHVLAENLNFVERIDHKIVGKKAMIPSLVEVAVSVDAEENAKDDDDTGISMEQEYTKEKVSVKAGENARKKLSKEETLSLWRDLVKNPLQWFDYRIHKVNGSVKDKFPDFKQKVTGNALWISSAPSWVLPGLEKLEFDVLDMQPKQVPWEKKPEYQKSSNADGSDDWKSLIENPDKWWDNRAGKRNSKYPDFKHKETGKGVWLDGIPAWALAKLPSLKVGQTS